MKECDNLVNLLPTNPMLLLHHVEEISVFQCGSIEVLFDINMSCFGKKARETLNLLRKAERYVISLSFLFIFIF